MPKRLMPAEGSVVVSGSIETETTWWEREWKGVYATIGLSATEIFLLYQGAERVFVTNPWLLNEWYGWMVRGGFAIVVAVGGIGLTMAVRDYNNRVENLATRAEEAGEKTAMAEDGLKRAQHRIDRQEKRARATRLRECEAKLKMEFIEAGLWSPKMGETIHSLAMRYVVDYEGGEALKKQILDRAEEVRADL